MGHAMSADFSGVKVLTNAQSDRLNKSIQAKAFTVGSDVFFRSGEYNPGSKGGQELLAHELTQVVQQRGSVKNGGKEKIKRKVLETHDKFKDVQPYLTEKLYPIVGQGMHAPEVVKGFASHNQTDCKVPGVTSVTFWCPPKTSLKQWTVRE